jgi:hypothetical protein
MKVRLCHHIFDNGKFCHAVALRGHIRCYHHHQAMKRRMKMARARVRMALRLAKIRQSGIPVPLVKKDPKSVSQPTVNLMESIG